MTRLACLQECPQDGVLLFYGLVHSRIGLGEIRHILLVSDAGACPGHATVHGDLLRQVAGLCPFIVWRQAGHAGLGDKVFCLYREIEFGKA